MTPKFKRGDKVKFTGGVHRGRLGKIHDATDDFYNVMLTDPGLSNEVKPGTIIHDVSFEFLRKA
jgi:hypothetical protein